MIDMGVAQNYCINRFRIKGKWLAIACLIFAATLDQTTIKQNPLISNRQQVTRTGYLTGCTMKLNINGQVKFSRQWS